MPAPILTPQQVADLRVELARTAYTGLDRLAANALLNTPLVISNGPAPKVLVPISTRQEEILSLLDPASAGKMTTSQLLDRALNHIETNSHRKFLMIVATAMKGNIISGREALEIQRLATQTQDDPSHATTRLGPTPFQAIAGLGDVEIHHPDGRITRGTCYPEFVDEARAA